MRGAVIVLFGCGLLLAGCQSIESRDHQECTAGGRAPGDPVYEDCMRYNQKLGIAPPPQRQWPSKSAEALSQGLMQIGPGGSNTVRCRSRQVSPTQVNTTCY
jgi:hypothetical protein